MGKKKFIKNFWALHVDEAIVANWTKTLYPVHTEHPDLYKKVSKNMVLIDEGEKYKI